MKMCQIEIGKVFDNIFLVGYKIDIVCIENCEYQYLYQEGIDFVFMNNEIFEQIYIFVKMIEKLFFLQEGMIVNIFFYVEEEILFVFELLMYIIFEVIYMELGVKGDMVINIMKFVIIVIGVDVCVLLFIDMGEIIKVDICIGIYVECVKK